MSKEAEMEKEAKIKTKSIEPFIRANPHTGQWELVRNRNEPLYRKLFNPQTQTKKMMPGTQVNILFTTEGPLSLEQRAIIDFHAQTIINKIGEGAGQIEYFIEGEDWDGE